MSAYHSYADGSRRDNDPWYSPDPFDEECESCGSTIDLDETPDGRLLCLDCIHDETETAA